MDIQIIKRRDRFYFSALTEKGSKWLLAKYGPGVGGESFNNEFLKETEEQLTRDGVEFNTICRT